MIFIVSRQEFSDRAGDLLATADTNLIIREKITE